MSSLRQRLGMLISGRTNAPCSPHDEAAVLQVYGEQFTVNARLSSDYTRKRKRPNGLLTTFDRPWEKEWIIEILNGPESWKVKAHMLCVSATLARKWFSALTEYAEQQEPSKEEAQVVTGAYRKGKNVAAGDRVKIVGGEVVRCTPWESNLGIWTDQTRVTIIRADNGNRAVCNLPIGVIVDYPELGRRDVH